MMADLPPNSNQQVAELIGTPGKCEISLDQIEDERGSRLLINCGNRSRFLGRTQKGVSVVYISPCSLTVMLNAVQFPRLLYIRNCAGPVHVRDLGKSWVQALIQKKRIHRNRVEYVSFEPLRDRRCYRLTVTYDLSSSTTDSKFASATGAFCIQLR
jgi:hypothetical protein